MAPEPAKEDPDESLLREERIRLRAYQYYVDRGYQPGSDLDDWLRAQEEILALEEQPSIQDP